MDLASAIRSGGDRAEAEHEGWDAAAAEEAEVLGPHDRIDLLDVRITERLGQRGDDARDELRGVDRRRVID